MTLYARTTIFEGPNGKIDVFLTPDGETVQAIVIEAGSEVSVIRLAPGAFARADEATDPAASEATVPS